jgi:hypothetical protein
MCVNFRGRCKHVIHLCMSYIYMTSDASLYVTILYWLYSTYFTLIWFILFCSMDKSNWYIIFIHTHHILYKWNLPTCLHQPRDIFHHLMTLFIRQKYYYVLLIGSQSPYENTTTFFYSNIKQTKYYIIFIPSFVDRHKITLRAYSTIFDSFIREK